MAEDCLGQRQPCRHQECWPVHRVKTDNILTDQMQIRRPEAREIAVLVWIANSGHIGRQSIDPDIHHMPR